MKKNLLLLAALLCVNVLSRAQNANTLNYSQAAVQPFLFSVNTLTGDSPQWNLNYSGSYGKSVTGPFGYDGLDQQVAVKGYLGHKFTLYANASLGFARSGGLTSAQQAELIRDFVGGKKFFGPRIGAGLGFSRDVNNVTAAISRITASFDALNWRFGGNLKFEKAFSQNRDNIDFISSIGFHHRIAGSVFAGLEALGQDLEGFWEEEEAEGGAKLFVGPSVNVAPKQSRLAFSVSGGPVFYATKNAVLAPSAIRDLSIMSENGYTVRAALSFNFQK